MSCELKIWPKLGVGVTTYPLPTEIVSSLKKAMMDDIPALKYVMIDLTNGKQQQGFEGDLDGMLATIDKARHYHLTAHEMQEACFRFANSKNQPLASSGQIRGQTFKKRAQQPMLPQPEVGSKMFRKDKRRRSFCTVVAVEGEHATVLWSHSGRKTKIKLTNLRSPSLYMTRGPAS